MLKYNNNKQSTKNSSNILEKPTIKDVECPPLNKFDINFCCKCGDEISMSSQLCGRCARK